MAVELNSIDAIQDFVRAEQRVQVMAGGSKNALSRNANLSLQPFSGVVEYEPSEFTFTARAGTRISEIRDLLAQHGQFLPFDPILVESGATVGGMVASGLAGAGRFRYGGVRDFLLGAQLINGEGDLVRGGGKVVKNAAGFDIPRLMVGSLGRYGVLVELTFKVFPSPDATTTLSFECQDLQKTFDALIHVSLSPAEVSCLDLVPPNQLWIRIAGMQQAMQQRVERIHRLVQVEPSIVETDDQSYWSDAREFRWVPKEHCLLEVNLIPSQIIECERQLSLLPAGPRRYSVGGNMLWLAWPESHELALLDHMLRTLQRPMLVIQGNCGMNSNGANPAGEFAKRLAEVFDPHNKFRNNDAA